MYDTCFLTKEQIEKLANGKSVIVKYQSIGEYGFTSSHDIEIIPTKKDDNYLNELVLNADKREMK